MATTTDRFRFLRGLGLAVASLLVISGAVFASQSGLPSGDDPLGSEASESEHASPSPSSSDLSAGELLDQLSQHPSADESESEEPMETPEAEASESEREHAAESPEASESEREHAAESPEASPRASSSPDDHGGHPGDDNSGPGGGGEDGGHDDH